MSNEHDLDEYYRVVLGLVEEAGRVSTFCRGKSIYLQCMYYIKFSFDSIR